MSLQICLAQRNCDHWKYALILKSPLKDSDAKKKKKAAHNRQLRDFKVQYHIMNVQLAKVWFYSFDGLWLSNYKIDKPFDPAIPLIRIYPNETIAEV